MTNRMTRGQDERKTGGQEYWRTGGQEDRRTVFSFGVETLGKAALWREGDFTDSGSSPA